MPTITSGYALSPTGSIRAFDAGCPVSAGEIAFDHLPDSSEIEAALPVVTLAWAKEIKVAELHSACAASIMAGVVHDALGAPHTYPMSATDQTNLLGRIAQAQIDPAGTFAPWCADGAGAWAKRSHTSAQTIQVGLAAAAWVQANSDKLSGPDGLGGLLKAVADALTVAAINEITW